MTMIKKNWLPILVGMIYLLLIVFRSDLALAAWENSRYYLLEMVQILPVIFLLTVAIDVLIPREWIVKRLGSDSGMIGYLFALAFGSLSAGPIYAAFPIAKTLYQKGAKVGNIVVILSAWAVIKVPMLANEVKFLGPEFMVVRWLLTVVFILLMALVIEKAGVKIVAEEEGIQAPVAVKSDYCIGCSACARKMPEIFVMQEGKALVQQDLSLDQEQKNQLALVAQKCPTQAIAVRQQE
ncbi:MAG: permease [Eubacteriaceae bacterium]